MQKRKDNSIKLIFTINNHGSDYFQALVNETYKKYIFYNRPHAVIKPINEI